MAKRKLPYNEGSCFVLPLRDVGCARGVVARMDGKGGIFGYFFGPRLSSIETARIDDLKPADAILLGQVGDLGLLKGEWTVIGQIRPWNRHEWPLPPLIRYDEKARRAWLCHYDEDTLSRTHVEEVSPTLVDSYPEEVVMGYVAAAIRVTKLLNTAKPL